MTSQSIGKASRQKFVFKVGSAILFAFWSVMLVTTFGPASPALAHDEITNTSPAADSTVDAGQFDVSITSSDVITDLEGQTTNDITVVGPLDQEDSGVVSAPCLRVSGNTASVPTQIDKPGKYRATWQIVGADGHPVSGSFTFDVTNDSGYQANGFDSLPADCKPTAMVTTTGENVASGNEGQDDHGTNHSDQPASDSGQWIGLLVGIGFVVFASIAGALTVKLREIYRAKKPRKLDQD